MNPARVRRRLTSWYALATLTLLCAALVVMRHFARRALQQEHESAVDRAGALVRSFFRAELAEYRRVDVTVSHLAGELVFAGMEITFLRPDGSVFAMARQPLAAAQLRPPFVVRQEPLDAALAPGWMLRLTISVADLARARQSIDRFTLFALPVAALLAALVAWALTGRALAPVARMADAADRLANAPGGRVPILNPDDEFGRLGSAFNRLLQRLETALDDQRRFLADAAHELRTPVARLLGATEARLAQPPSPDDRAALEEFQAELRRTATSVDALLHLARADSGALSVDRGAVFLDDVASDVVTRLAHDAGARGITLDADGLDEAPVVADPILLDRLIVVLLENALRYTPAGGTVRVTTERRDAVSALRVEDSGIGVPREERNAVFERFVRGHAARQLAPDGTGLGLAIARSIVAAHDGSIDIDDSPLGGAAFVVRLPASW